MAENPSASPQQQSNLNVIESGNNNPSVTQQQQFLQQNNLLLASNYQGGGLQRTPSISRLNNNNNNSNNNNSQIGGIYGQMSFAQQQQHQNQQMSRSVLMGNHLPLLSSQAQLNLQSQLLSPRQKLGLIQGTQFNAGVNSAGQTLQNMHAMGIINPLNINSQMRTNGTLGFSQQHRLNHQMRQEILQQASLASNPGQGLQRNSYMNAQLSGLTQNGQPVILQNSQQQYFKQMPAISTPNSPSYRVQQQRQQQLNSMGLNSQQQLNSMGLNSQQLSQLAQQQQQQPLTPAQQLLNQQSQSSPRMTPGQRSVSLTGSHPDATASGNTNSGGRSSQGTEASNQVLGKRKIQDLVSQVDPRGRLDPEVEDLLLELADDFIDSVTTFACNLAKNRNSTTLESKDVLLHLEKNWNLTVPGFSSEERKNRQNPQASNDLHKKRCDTIRALMESSQSEAPINNNNKEVARPGIINPGNVNHMMRPSPSSDQLLSHSNSSQMLQQLNRF